jgi:hypothetical protein
MEDVLNHEQGMRSLINQDLPQGLRLFLFQLVRTQVSERVLSLENHLPKELPLESLQQGALAQMNG